MLFIAVRKMGLDARPTTDDIQWTKLLPTSALNPMPTKWCPELSRDKNDNCTLLAQSTSVSDLALCRCCTIRSGI
jgi:hypothetical protein